MKSGANYHYFHTDHLGTPQKLTNKGGATTWAANYSGFGAATVNTSTVTNPIRFPGQYYDSETGLHQNFMRDYDPEIGAYLEQDPYGILTGPNRYGYVYGDPVGLSDPTGEIVPLLIAGGAKVLFVTGGLIVGINVYDCAQYLWDSCLSTDEASVCQSFEGPPPQGLVDFAAGFGDTISFGLTDWIRGIMGTNSVVDRCSRFYKGGEWAGIGWGVALGAAGLTRGGFRAELGNWKSGGQWFLSKTTPVPHFHFGRGVGLQGHHLPWEGVRWWKNFKSLARRGLAGSTISDLSALGFGFGVPGKGLIDREYGCE